MAEQTALDAQGRATRVVREIKLKQVPTSTAELGDGDKPQ